MNNEETMEISITGIIAVCLAKLKYIICIPLALAIIIMGAYFAYVKVRGNEASAYARWNSPDNPARIELALLKSQYDKMDKDISSGPLMKIDPNNASQFVMKYEIAAEDIEQIPVILKSYTDRFDNVDLHELLSSSYTNDQIRQVIYASGEDSLLTVSVFGDDESYVNYLSSIINDQFYSFQTDINKAYPHLLNTISYVFIQDSPNLDIMKRQQDIANTQSIIAASVTKLESKISSSRPGRPVMWYAKYGIVLFIVFAFIAVVYYVFRMLLDSSYTLEEAVRAPFIGSYGKVNPIVKFITHERIFDSVEKSNAFIQEKLKYMVGDNKNVLFLSTRSIKSDIKNDLSSVADSLKFKAVFIENARLSSDLPEALSNDSVVIICEELFTTQLREIKELVAIVNQSGKTAHGCIATV
jgi:hypothetical protein